MWLQNPTDRALLLRHPALMEARLRHPPAVAAYVAQLWAGALWSSLTWLPTVRVPTLVVHGESDSLVPPANGLQLARLLSESRVHVLPSEGHLLVFDPEGAAVPLLADFFSSDTLEESHAWATGKTVDDDATVSAAFATSVGATPHRQLSSLFRWVATRVYHPKGDPSTNGS
jgi:hypothetical protein